MTSDFDKAKAAIRATLTALYENGLIGDFNFEVIHSTGSATADYKPYPDGMMLPVMVKTKAWMQIFPIKAVMDETRVIGVEVSEDDLSAKNRDSRYVEFKGMLDSLRDPG